MTSLRRDRRLTCWAGAGALVMLLGCNNDPPAGGSTGSSSSSSSGESSTGMVSATSSPVTTNPPPQTTAVDDTTFGAGCGPDPCAEQCGEGCEALGTCIASEWMCECDCPVTGTEGTGCPTLPDALDEWVDPSLTPAIDCGTVGLKDDAMAWQTVHDCIVLSMEGSSFRASWTQLNGEAQWEYGAGGRVVDGYALGWFEGPDPLLLIRYACTTIEATPECVVDSGQMCLECTDQAEDEVVCVGP